MDKFCCLLGNNNPFLDEKKLKNAIIEVIENKNINKFYLGNNGIFDSKCRTILEDLKTLFNIEIYVVLSYFPHNKYNTSENKNYSNKINFVYPDNEFVPPKFAISSRNKWMINNSSFIIFYIDYIHNANKFLELAKKKNKKFINLGKLN